MDRGTASRTTYEQFLEFERLIGRPRVSRINARPLGFCAFALTFFVYSMVMTGATVPQPTAPAVAMGLALFYGGVIQLIAGILEFRQGNNFYGLQFCSYAGYFLGLASLYIAGSFGFFTTSNVANIAVPFNPQLNVADFTVQEKSLGIFYLGWTIFTLCMLIASIRTNVLLIVYFFFLLVAFALWTAAKFLTTNYPLQTAGGAVGIFTACLAWIAGFASLLRRGDNSYFEIPVFSLEPKTRPGWSDEAPIEIQTTTVRK